MKNMPKMITDLPDMNDTSLAGLVKIYNGLVAEGKRIKKFKDRPTAIRRITEQFVNENPPKYKQKKDPTEKQVKEFAEVVKAKKEKSPAPEVFMKIEVPEKKTLHFDLQVTKTLSDASAAFPLSLMGRKTIYGGQYLYKREDLLEKNPRRAGSHGWFSWNKLVEGMMFEDAVAAGARPRDVIHDARIGNLIFEKKKR